MARITAGGGCSHVPAIGVAMDTGKTHEAYWKPVFDGFKKSREWMEKQKMEHIRGAPFHPQTQGKIERWHQTMKNRILLENYYLPGDLEQQIGVFVDHYNNHRYHESLNNVTPADVYFGRDKDILRERETIKKQTIQQRRLQHQRQAA